MLNCKNERRLASYAQGTIKLLIRGEDFLTAFKVQMQNSRMQWTLSKIIVFLKFGVHSIQFRTSIRQADVLTVGVINEPASL